MMLLPSSHDAALAAHLASASPYVAAHFRSQLMIALRRAHPDQIEHVIRNAVITLGGTLIEPERGDWSAQQWELTLLGISVTGWTMQHLAHEWMAAMQRMAADQP